MCKLYGILEALCFTQYAIGLAELLGKELVEAMGYVGVLSNWFIVSLVVEVV